jgi:hypothetical protein
MRQVNLGEEAWRWLRRGRRPDDVANGAVPQWLVVVERVEAVFIIIKRSGDVGEAESVGQVMMVQAESWMAAHVELRTAPEQVMVMQCCSSTVRRFALLLHLLPSSTRREVASCCR